MSPFQRKLAARSRDRQFLIRGAIITVATCTILGFVLSKFIGSPPTQDERKEEMVKLVIAYESQRDRQELTDLLLMRGEPTPEAIAEYIRFAGVFIEENLIPRSSLERQSVLERVPFYDAAKLVVDSNQGALTEAQKNLFHHYASALYQTGADRETAVAFLETQAAVADPPVRFANEFLGHVLSRTPKGRAAALSHFQIEAEAFPRADFSRFQLLNLNLALRNRAELRALLRDPEYRRLANPYFLTEIGIGLRSPGLILSGVVRADLDSLASPILPLSLFAGLVWFIVLAKLGGIARPHSFRLLLYALALVAGFFSATLTLLFVVWQDNVFGFQLNGDFVNDVLYCVSGIALREEVAKILLFLPFVPILVKRRTQMEMLITAGCVGLGFAINENIGYFVREAPAAAFPRLLTASFAHVSLTGILGLALCRFIRWPKQCWEEVVGTFVAVVLVHGAYDAFLIVRELKEQVGALATVVFAVLVYFFFKKVKQTREPVRQVISPLGVFVFGSSLVIGMSWIFSMCLYGLDPSLEGVGKGALGVAVLAFVYINELKNE